MNRTKRYFIVVVIILFLSPCVKTCINWFAPEKSESYSYSSLADFVQNCTISAPPKLDFDHIIEELNQFVGYQCRVQCEPNLWLDQVIPPQAWFDLNDFHISDDYRVSNQFFPFVQKLKIPKESIFAVWGDLHGSVDTVVKSLLQLRQDGYLDNQLNIIKENFYCVFLGDFVDGNEDSGIELLYLVMKFHNQNPGKVFLLRGNHEDAAVNKKFRNELFQKYPEVKLEQLKNIFCLYDHLPVALFVGIDSGNETPVQGVQFCHAGFEIGYNAQKLLASDASFELITRLNRRSILKKLPDGQTKEQLCGLCRLVDKVCVDGDRELFYTLTDEAKMELCVINNYNWLMIQFLFWMYGNEITKALPMLFEDIEIKPTTNLGAIRLGFSWNSFTDCENNRRLGSRQDQNILWHCAIFNMGPEATEYFLQLNSTEKWMQKMVIRGHQHQGKMLEDLRAGKGFAQWFGGKLVTIIASPFVTGYQSFALLHLSARSENWFWERYVACQGEHFSVESLSAFAGNLSNS